MLCSPEYPPPHPFRRYAPQERVILLEAWRDFEVEKGNAEMVQAVSAKLPQKIKKRRMVHAEDGTELGWEEYYDYIFPDEDQRKSNFKVC